MARHACRSVDLAFAAFVKLTLETHIPGLSVLHYTSAHDALNGYVPNGMSLEDALTLRRKDPDGYIERAMHSMAVHVDAMLALQEKGAITFDYGNNIRAQAQKAGIKNNAGSSVSIKRFIIMRQAITFSVSFTNRAFSTAFSLSASTIVTCPILRPGLVSVLP